MVRFYMLLVFLNVGKHSRISVGHIVGVHECMCASVCIYVWVYICVFVRMRACMYAGNSS